MKWRVVEPGVYFAEGDRLGYLVWFDEADCLVKLTRWHLVQRGWPTVIASTGLVREATRHLVSRPLSRGPGRPPMLPDAEAGMARLRDAAEAFEGRSGAPELGRSDWLHLDEPASRPPSWDKCRGAGRAGGGRRHLMDVLLNLRIELKGDGTLPDPDYVRALAEDNLTDLTRRNQYLDWHVARVTQPEQPGDRVLVAAMARYAGHVEDMDLHYRLWMLGALQGVLSRLLSWPDAAELAALKRDVPDLVRQLRELANELEDAGAEERPDMLRRAASELEEHA